MEEMKIIPKFGNLSVTYGTRKYSVPPSVHFQFWVSYTVNKVAIFEHK